MIRIRIVDTGVVDDREIAAGAALLVGAADGDGLIMFIPHDVVSDHDVMGTGVDENLSAFNRVAVDDDPIRRRCLRLHSIPRVPCESVRWSTLL